MYNISQQTKKEIKELNDSRSEMYKSFFEADVNRKLENNGFLPYEISNVKEKIYQKVLIQNINSFLEYKNKMDKVEKEINKHKNNSIKKNINKKKKIMGWIRRDRPELVNIKAYLNYPAYNMGETCFNEHLKRVTELQQVYEDYSNRADQMITVINTKAGKNHFYNNLDQKLKHEFKNNVFNQMSNNIARAAGNPETLNQVYEEAVVETENIMLEDYLKSIDFGLIP